MPALLAASAGDGLLLSTHLMLKYTSVERSTSARDALLAYRRSLAVAV
jgi:hypothetical protein